MNQNNYHNNKRNYNSLYMNKPISQLLQELVQSPEYDSENEPLCGHYIRSTSPDSRGSSDNWYISDNGFVVSDDESDWDEIDEEYEPPKKRRRIMQVTAPSPTKSKQTKKKKKKVIIKNQKKMRNDNNNNKSKESKDSNNEKQTTSRTVARLRGG